MPNGGEQDDELDQGVELEAEIVDEGQGDDLAEHGKALDGLLQQAQQAGLGDAPQAATLKHIRRALRRSKQYIQEAEERGRQRALAEFAAGDGGQAVDAIRQQVRQELQEETARERSLARLGIAPDSPIRGLFDGVSGNHKAFERQAALLRAAGVSWDSDPVLRRIGQEQVAAWQQHAAAATNGNGPPVDLDPAGPVPEQVREQVIRQQVTQMAAAQAGGQPPGSEDLASQIRRAAQNPAGADAMGLADRLNRELEGLSSNLRGLPTGEGW